jgi:large subunit ribosomal protein L10
MKKIFSSNESVMIAHYQGLNVIQLDALRKELRENGIVFKVTKNRITKLAVKETPLKELEKFFTGPTATAVSSDPFMSARILTKFAKTNNKLKIVAGFMEGKVIDQAEVAKIASLPTLNEARANIVGILKAPAQKIIGILLAQSKKMSNLAPAEEIKN